MPSISSKAERLAKTVDPKAVEFLNSLRISKVALFYYLNRVSIKTGERPVLHTVFNLNQVQVFQKVSGGYLIRYNAPGEGPSPEYEVAFLETDKNLPEDFHFLGFTQWAVYSGEFSYQALSGFDRIVYKFMMLNEDANPRITARSGIR